MEPSDTELARRWKRGDRDAAAMAMARHADALGAIAYGILGDAALAEDVVQETYVRAASGIRRLKDGTRLGGYLMGIARNTAHHAAKKRRRERPLEPGAYRVPGDPGAAAQRGELRAHLRAAVEQLPCDQREIFLLKYVGGLSYRKIGRSLGMSETAVSQKLWRVRQKLQETLREIYR